MNTAFGVSCTSWTWWWPCFGPLISYFSCLLVFGRKGVLETGPQHTAIQYLRHWFLIGCAIVVSICQSTADAGLLRVTKSFRARKVFMVVLSLCQHQVGDAAGVMTTPFIVSCQSPAEASGLEQLPRCVGRFTRVSSLTASPWTASSPNCFSVACGWYVFQFGFHWVSYCRVVSHCSARDSKIVRGQGRSLYSRIADGASEVHTRFSMSLSQRATMSFVSDGADCRLSRFFFSSQPCVE